ncbi:MAG: esterase [Ignavibacteria bacterium]|nr:esterase [Ignavibacteria bacterium]MBT8381087.1 esterase [Ignavibacteria bacterium]MBT8391914.1 esterase [Ignavibacteria bacterium]NNJ53634.1 esterase [Ignavibacteriaceae bacterium]NNL19985.1 esterase [Ignavibacteriaceae bacterium]
MLILLFVLQSFSVLAQEDDLQLNSFSHKGIERTYYIHLSTDFSEIDSLPLLMVLHGGGKGDGDDLAKHFGFNIIADRERFITVYPNGIDSRWNDGRGKTFNEKKDLGNIDDVGFLSALIDTMIANYKVNPNRVFVTGVSNGGMMTFRLGCEIASKLSAIAPVIANIPENIIYKCTPDSRLPVLIMNGTEDPLVPWEGGKVKFLWKEMGKVVSTENSVRFWVEHNKCFEDPVTELLPDIDDEDESRVKKVTYKNKDTHIEVVLYAIVGGGHNIPGGNTPDIKLIIGNKNNDINAAEVIWNFFKKSP